LSKAIWNPEFTPSYTPYEMLKMGIFEGKYINNIKGLPKKYFDIPNVLGPNDDPDPTLNYYGVKSRQSLSEWKKKGWIGLDANGWFAWYVRYWEGRRDDKEDTLQIGRWKSFVARHNAQVQAKCKKGDDSCNTKQRQGLLQWAWNSDTAFTDTQRTANLKRLQKQSEVSLESRTAKAFLEW
jgi:hypothetical protein